MHALIILASSILLHYVNASPRPSPVQIAIDNLNANEGSRIDLSENYHPLATAKATKDVKNARVASRAYAPRPAILSRPSLSLEKAEQIQAELESAYSATGWLPWSEWSECINGEKIRYRSCVPTLHVNCVGMKIEKQPCFLAEPIEIPFARDPWVIEREISQGYERPSEP